MASRRAKRTQDPGAWMSAVGRLMAHPARVAILLALAREGIASPSDAADAASLDLPTSAYHMRSLTRLGMVRLCSTGRVRGATEHFYELSSEGHAAVRAIEAVATLHPNGAEEADSGGSDRRRARRRATG